MRDGWYRDLRFLGRVFIGVFVMTAVALIATLFTDDPDQATYIGAAVALGVMTVLWHSAAEGVWPYKK